MGKRRVSHIQAHTSAEFGYDYEYDNVIKKTDVELKQRKITSTRIDKHLDHNAIQTSKYTTINFVPKNLIEQFSKLANVYFLLFGLIQLIPSISISNGVPTIYIPLVAIVVVTAVKDFYEDYKRKKSDREENESECHVLHDGVFQKMQWQDIRVGDIVKVKKDQFFPCDMLVLNSSEPKGLCYIETKGLDGETNLKQKMCQKDLYAYFLNNKSQEEFNEDVFNKKKFVFGYEQPNPLLGKFDGYAELPNEKDRISIDAKNFLLRGCSLKNTHFIYGLASNTGHDTKIQKNSFKARAKRSRLEHTMNNQVLLIFLIQIVICIICGVVYVLKEDTKQQKYLEYVKEEDIIVFFKKFGNWILIFGNFVPISLLVTLEFVKLFQAIFIEQDNAQLDDERLMKPNQHGMMYFYNDENGERHKVKTAVQSSNLNEELGQIEYVFSDKTGTLTCNIMQFKKMSINGVSYGEIEDPAHPHYLPDQEWKTMPKVTNVNFRDKQLLEAVNDPQHPQHQEVMRNMILLAVTHTILVSEEQDKDDFTKTKKTYNASSPDELALVNFAKYCGVEYIGTDENDNAVISVKGQKQTIEVLHTFEFDSTRKRQSVVIRDPKTKKVKLFCKGADSVILKLSDIKKSKNLEALTRHLEEYSLIGLRTLLLSEREIPDKVYSEWAVRYNKATTALTEREQKMNELQQELEVDLIVVGGTAIEDQLQDEVGETIAALKQAGIKVWVLTGDKVETARNIGYSCKLLNQNIKQYKVDLSLELALDNERGMESVNKQLSEVIKEINQRQEEFKRKNKGGQIDTNNALIITGDALIHGLKEEIATKIIEITKYCEAVLCCRVSPKQKQQIVTLVRNFNPKVSTLAIGDGANDVNMITAAHVGIGIKGLEGYQAARASDYAIGEFKLLRRLLFFHGREAYRRNARLVCYNFYKNILIVTPQFFYGISNFFSGQTLYDPYIYQIYNVFYTSIPIIVYAVMDLEFNPAVLQHNKLNYYRAGIEHKLYNGKVFWRWFFSGFLQSAIITSVCLLACALTFGIEDGQTYDFWSMGMMSYGLTVWIANLKVLIISFDHTFFSLFFTLGSIGLYYLSFYVLDNLTYSELYNHWEIAMEAPIIHLGYFLGIIACSFLFDYSLERYLRCQANKERLQVIQSMDTSRAKKSHLSQIVPEGSDNNSQKSPSSRSHIKNEDVIIQDGKNNSDVHSHSQIGDENKQLVNDSGGRKKLSKKRSKFNN